MVHSRKGGGRRGRTSVEAYRLCHTSDRRQWAEQTKGGNRSFVIPHHRNRHSCRHKTIAAFTTTITVTTQWRAPHRAITRNRGISSFAAAAAAAAAG